MFAVLLRLQINFLTERATRTLPCLADVSISPGTPQVIHNFRKPQAGRYELLWSRRLGCCGRGNRRSRCSLRGVGCVDQGFQFLAGLEVGDLLCWYVHARAGLRIAPNTRFALTRAETSESANLNLVAGLQ